jgi:hypothetical protein
MIFFKPLEQFFSYSAAVTITGDKTAKDMCLAHMDFKSDDSLTRHTCCNMGHRFKYCLIRGRFCVNW